MLKTQRTLKRVKLGSTIIRLICLATVFPVFHACACIGRTKVPTVDKVAAGILTAAVVSNVKLNKKQEELERKIQEARAARNR